MRVGDRGAKLPSDIIDAYRGISPATMGHMPSIRIMSSVIKPGYSHCSMVGQAFTARSIGVDISAVNEACQLIEHGEIMVVDRGGDAEYACIGEFRALDQQLKNVAGWVVDGAATDVIECSALKFPIFVRSWSALVGRSLPQNDGAVNMPIVCGGVTVYPGDLIVADDNGVAVIDPKDAVQFLDHFLKVEDQEAQRRLEYGLDRPISS